MPAVVRAAEKLSEHGQRTTLRLEGARLAAGVGAATAAVAAAAATRLHALAWAAAALFLVALLLELVRSRLEPQRDWHDGRLVAERAKSLTWLYVAGVGPFGPTVPDHEAHRVLLEGLDDLVMQGPAERLDLPPAPPLPDAVQRLRSAPDHERRTAYLDGRVVEQQSWYSTRARRARALAARWQSVLVTIEAVGLALSVLWATGAVELDAGGVAGAALAAGSAWLAIKQHASLASSYGATAAELSTVATRLGLPLDPEEWSAAVAGAEAALSREHTAWFARRR